MMERIEPVQRHYQASPEFAAFVASLPKAERHLHLEGSFSFEQLHAFDPDRYPDPPPFWDPTFRYSGFGHFQEMFDEWCVPYHHCIEHYHASARYVFAQCVAQGCRYVETSFHLPVVNWLGIDGPEMLAAILDAAPEGMPVRVFGGMTHNDYAEHGALLEAALKWDALSGIDLHGPEYHEVDPEFVGYWQRARDHGKLTKAHAGEFMPASFVDWAIGDLGASRIQHGVRAAESEDVMQKLAARQIPLDVCPISNLKLGVEGIATMSKHPVRQLVDAGVCVTVNTDDTFMFGNTLAEEYFALSQDLNFNAAELVQLARNGFQGALMEDDLINNIMAELDTIEQAL